MVHAGSEDRGVGSSDKPKAIISGPSQSGGIARFASRTTYEDLAPERRERLKVSVLDALACAISALGAPRSKHAGHKQTSSAAESVAAL